MLVVALVALAASVGVSNSESAAASSQPVRWLAAQEPIDISNDEVDATGHYDIVIDGQADEIDVETDLNITFRKPSQRVGNTIYQYYLTDWYLIVPKRPRILRLLIAPVNSISPSNRPTSKVCRWSRSDSGATFSTVGPPK